MEQYDLVYKNEKNKNYIRLLGEDFFKRNEVSGYFIYKNVKYKLKDKLETKSIKESQINIKLRFFKLIYNKSLMFKDCDSLIKFSIPKIKYVEQSSNILKIFEEEENLIDQYIDDNNYSDKTMYTDLEELNFFPEFSDICKKPEEYENNSNKTTLKNIRDILKNII